jgi:hypothetical protein
MKKTLIVFWVVLLSVSWEYICVADTHSPVNLNTFFNALKTGNIDLIKQYISGDLYERKKNLLEKNSRYSAFLRNWYKDAEFRVKKVVNVDEDVIADVEILFPDGSYELIKIRAAKSSRANVSGAEEGMGISSWKIVEEIKDGEHFRIKHDSLSVSRVMRK